EIRPAVAVVVAYRDAHAESPARHARLLRDIGERAIAVVVVEGVAKGRMRVVKVTLPAVDEIKVQPSVVIVVNEPPPAAEGLRQIKLRRTAILMDPGDAALGGGNLLKSRWPRRGRRGLQGIEQRPPAPERSAACSCNPQGL